MKKKIFFSIILFVAAFSLVGIAKIKAQVFTGKASGWLWGGSEESNDATINGNETGVGWISMNNANPGAGGVVAYGVNIPPATCGAACGVTGYAWAGNDDNGSGGPLGWIDFNPQDHCTVGVPTADQYQAASCFIPGSTIDKGGVTRSGNNLVGWARIVGIAQETAQNNAGGWDGWIQMDPAVAGFGVTIAADATGKETLSGFAWNGEADAGGGVISGLGALSFSGISLAGGPRIGLTANPGQIDVETAAQPLTTELTLTSDAPLATCNFYCRDKDGNDAGCTNWPTGINVPMGGVTGKVFSNVAINKDLVTFHVDCVGADGLVSNSFNTQVTAGCLIKTCTSTGECKVDFSNTETFKPMTTFDSVLCEDKCSDNSSCAARKTGIWKEIAP